MYSCLQLVEELHASEFTRNVRDPIRKRRNRVSPKQHECGRANAANPCYLSESTNSVGFSEPEADEYTVVRVFHRTRIMLATKSTVLMKFMTNREAWSQGRVFTVSSETLFIYTEISRSWSLVCELCIQGEFSLPTPKACAPSVPLPDQNCRPDPRRMGFSSYAILFHAEKLHIIMHRVA